MPRACHLILVLAFLGLPSVALGAVPAPWNCDVPALMRVVAPRGTGVDSAATYTVVVRDAANVPMSNSYVTLSFSDCDHVKFSPEQPFYPPLQVDCASPSVSLSTLTDAAGRASFLVLGSVLQRWPSGPEAQCVFVRADGVPIGYASPAAYDQDGVGGLSANDLSLVSCDYSSNFARSDFNGDGLVDGFDVANWMNQYFNAHGSSRTPERCDSLPTSFAETVLYQSPLRLAWDACASQGGQQTKAFGCFTNFGGGLLEASFVAPPGVEAMTGFEADLVVAGNQGSPLPEWWRFEPDGCRSALSTIDVSGSLTSCLPVGDLPGIGGLRMEYAPGNAVGLIRVIGAVANTQPGVALQAGEEYSLFALRIPYSRAVGTESCPGCNAPVALLFRRLKLTQPPTGDPACLATGPPTAGDFVLFRDESTSEAFAFWQAPPEGWDVLDAPPTPISSAIRLWSANPSRDAARVEFSIPRPMPCTLALYDITGRRRRVLLHETIPAGAHALTWDGRDDHGQLLASGYYVLRLVTEEGTRTRSLIRLR